MDDSKTLVLIRHGELPEAYHGRFVGALDVPLSEEGWDECRKLKERFSELAPERIFASPMRRTRESAEAVCPDRTDIVFDDRLREIAFGDWENLTFEEIRKKAPPEMLAVWTTHPEKMRFPNGDVLSDFNARVDSFLADVLAMKESVIAVITHGGVLMRMIAQLKGIPPERQFEVLPPRGSLKILHFRKGQLVNEE